WQNQRVWRISHYPPDPNGSDDVDLYDLDPSTLAPLRSYFKNEAGAMELTFAKDHVEVRRRSPPSEVTERVELSGPVMPEGPGLTPFIATLPLRPGFAMNYQVVDRWSGNGNSRLKEMSLRVLKSQRVVTAFGRVDALEILLRPRDESFEIDEFVVADGLHWPLHMLYSRGSMRLRSEVEAIAIATNWK